MKAALVSLTVLLGLSTHAVAQCVPQSEKIISTNYKVSVECGKFRNGPVTYGITSPEACAATCRDSSIADAVCSYQASKKGCIIAKPDAEMKYMASIYLMAPIKDTAADICRQDLKACLASDTKCATDLTAADQRLKDKQAELAQCTTDLGKYKTGAAGNAVPKPPAGGGADNSKPENCGGSLIADSTADLIRTLEYTTAPDCKKACLQDPACKSYNLWGDRGKNSQHCRLLNKTAKKVESRYDFHYRIYDRNCP